MDVRDRRRFVSIGLVLLSIPFYIICTLRHVCMAGHMKHPPYFLMDGINDGIWLGCLIAAGTMAMGANLPGKRALLISLSVPVALRLGGAGAFMVFLAELPLLACALFIVLGSFIWPSKATASPSRPLPLGWIAAAVAIPISAAVALCFTHPGSDPRTRSRFSRLNAGAFAFEDDHEYLPGEKSLNQLITNGGRYTGSQILAACLFDYPIEQIGGSIKPRSYYAVYTDTSLFTLPEGKHPNTLADDTHEPMAICYYVARPGKTGLDRFVEGDNSVYTDAAKGGDFAEFLRTRSGNRLGRLDEMDFLLIAPGKDRKYFTEDDLTNW